MPWVPDEIPSVRANPRATGILTTSQQPALGRRRAYRHPSEVGGEGVDANKVINTALAGEMELNARLTQLEQGYDASRADLHLEPGNLRRVVDTALRINHQSPLIPIGDEYTNAEVFELPTLTSGWHDALKGLDTRLNPGVLRPITFDPVAAQGRNDLVYVHLGHPIVQKSQRLLRSSLWSVDSPLNRVTAVVVDDLPASFVATVTRMVLVGRGGLRLHEDVFLAGVRLKGRRARDGRPGAGKSKRSPNATLIRSP
jgi:hypothetical protein